METIGPYEIEKTCRMNAVGRVVVARHQQLNRRVYLKELCPSPAIAASDREELYRAFERECASLAGTLDLRVARPVDVGLSAAGTRYLAFELPTAHEPLPDDPGALSAEEWLRLGVEVGGTLSGLLAGEIPLRWLEPECFFLSRPGEVAYLHLSLEHLMLPFADRYGAPSPRFGAPEIARPEVAAEAALVFSVGAWLYRALSNDPTTSPAAAVAAGRTPEPLWHLNPAVPAVVDETVRKALSPDPAQRYGSMAAFTTALECCRAKTAASGRPPVPAFEPTLAFAGAEERFAAWHYAAWAGGMGLAGSAIGWALARVIPLP